MFLLREKWAALLFSLGLLIILCIVGGCGKKAPPIAPRQPAMNAVSDLTAQYSDGVVALAWQHQPAGTAITGYVVYRYRQALAATACPGCPLLFEKAATVPLDPDGVTEGCKLTWSQPLAGGYRYTFKVVPVQSSGAHGPDSNLAKVEAIQ